MVDGAPYLVLGAQVNNSSAWPADAAQGVAGGEDGWGPTPSACPLPGSRSSRIEGKFDFSFLDTLLAEARSAGAAARPALVRHLEEQRA